MDDKYHRQVRLLLEVLPEIAKEDCFTLHGGTAINLFIRNMPRLSVDIDLTYTLLEDRRVTLFNINHALDRIMECIRNRMPSVHVQLREDICKLLISHEGSMIKVEVNTVGRGLLSDAVRIPLCDAAQEEFDTFIVMPLVPFSQLYGGKLCAALDRQHPRDIFDVRLLLDNEGLTDETRKGLVLGLSGSSRPTHEMLKPNHHNQQTAFRNQFEGMSSIAFTHTDYETTRKILPEKIRSCLDEKDRRFLLSMNQLEPDWSIHPIEAFPAVQWKLKNLEKFRKTNPVGYRRQLRELERILDGK